LLRARQAIRLSVDSIGNHERWSEDEETRGARPGAPGSRSSVR